MAEDISIADLQDALVGDESPSSDSAKMAEFEVTNLFGRPISHKIEFPLQITNIAGPPLLILMGPNGCGKTTVLRMIDGMLRLDFDIFRQIPFAAAKLTLSTGQELSVKPTEDKSFPLRVSFDHHDVVLSRDKTGYTQEQREPIDAFRADALPVMQTIRYQLIDIHRSLALREPVDEHIMAERALARASHMRSDSRRPEPSRELSRLVLNFVREAQVNYRKFFAADRLELLPKILGSIAGAHQVSAQKSDLAAKVSAIKARSPLMARIGLQTDDPDLDTLATLLSSESQYDDNASLAVLATYVATQETRSQTRELIAERLLSFEKLMDDFLVGKTVRVLAQSCSFFSSRRYRDLSDLYDTIRIT